MWKKCITCQFENICIIDASRLGKQNSYSTVELGGGDELDIFIIMKGVERMDVVGAFDGC